MHILFLSHYYPPEVNAPASRTSEHAKQWVKKGAKVSVITNHPNHPYGVIYEGHKNRWLTRESVDGVDIFRVKTFLGPNAGFSLRTANYLFFMFAAIVASLWVKKPDVVVATSPQFFCAGAGFFVSRLKKRPFVFELRDIWPESIVTVGAMKKGLIINLLERVELFLYRKAKAVVAVTDAFKENLIRRKIPKEKIHVIKNGVNPDFFKPAPSPKKLTDRLGAGGKFIAAYIGTVGMAHAVDKILEVAELLKDDPEILFMIVGEGAKKQDMVDLAAQKKLTNVMILPGVSKKEIRDYYAMTDLNLVTLRKSDLFKTVIPSKIFEIMAMARPILCSVDGECREIIEESKGGVFTPPEDVRRMAEAVKALSGERERLKQMGGYGREFVINNFNRNRLAEGYLEIMNHMVLKDTKERGAR